MATCTVLGTGTRRCCTALPPLDPAPGLYLQYTVYSSAGLIPVRQTVRLVIMTDSVRSV